MSSSKFAGFRHGQFTLEQAWKWEKGEVSCNTLVPVAIERQVLLSRLGSGTTECEKNDSVRDGSHIR